MPIKSYIVPLKDDGYDPYSAKADQTGHILFMETMYGRTDIFKSNYYWTDKPNPQNHIGHLDFELTPELITQWCYRYFKNCSKHPAIIKLDLENHRQEIVYTDSYIEDFVKDNYDEIMEKLNEKA